MPKCLIANILWRKNNAKIWDQNCLIWVFLRCLLKPILSYLKSAPSNLFNFKFSSKIKISKLGTKNALFGYFWARIFKNYCHIWNQHPRSCLIGNFCENQKCLNLDQKCFIWVFLGKNLKTTLSYLELASSSLSNCKISRNKETI